MTVITIMVIMTVMTIMSVLTIMVVMTIIIIMNIILRILIKPGDREAASAQQTERSPPCLRSNHPRHNLYHDNHNHDDFDDDDDGVAGK